ncbi:cytochrome b/b6 domain-containing protein [Sulfitobacter sp.]|uniref:cytochrome b/b6 domain-containing protein n=1 Tax=Sulfitobacter sp. TaxID=1903071 RepID=UPI003002FED1
MFGVHASSGRYNAGEKAWFWTATLAGIALSASGIILSFPNDLGTHDLLHRAELLHAIAALVFIGFGVGHIYLATIGTEGAIEGMVNGDVDENWARTHHDLWLSEMEAIESKADT